MREIGLEIKIVLERCLCMRRERMGLRKTQHKTEVSGNRERETEGKRAHQRQQNT